MPRRKLPIVSDTSATKPPKSPVITTSDIRGITIMFRMIPVSETS